MNKIVFALPLSLALAACGSADEPPTDLENAESDGAAAALARNIEAGEFLDLDLGAKIVGPQGPEVTSALSNAEGNFADMRSFVACPADMTECDPATAPEGTIYTYVHVVYPGEDNEAGTGSGEGNDSSDVERATAFRMTRPATGFTGAAGYSKDEAMAAIGAKADVVITCDDGALVWTVSAGDGGDQWEQAEPLTFWWQSTVAPAGPVAAYAIDANYAQATGSGPYPADAPGAPNACNAPAVAGAEG
ncbi:MAG: hypothetical protein OSA41_02945 [Erythrobacter sp.]|jgi:hypothetical protein|uniref:hypothetical protein n=1 Tax=Qipengyuania citrea TaxID=225971 RepID=UPI00209D1FFF|nr:hypothetical protein [Qipengyuania citrea]MCP2016583.1 hypothetical protein [Qipengyuania citrea]MDE0900661.1 hypothetical protein [Erythrobacter sp.]